MATTPDFTGKSGRFTLIPLNMNSINEKTPDNGELLADFVTGELAIALVNELNGEILGVLNPFKTLRAELQDEIEALVKRANDGDAIHEVTAVLIEQLQENFETAIQDLKATMMGNVSEEQYRDQIQVSIQIIRTALAGSSIPPAVVTELESKIADILNAMDGTSLSDATVRAEIDEALRALQTSATESVTEEGVKQQLEEAIKAMQTTMEESAFSEKFVEQVEDTVRAVLSSSFGSSLGKGTQRQISNIAVLAMSGEA